MSTKIFINLSVLVLLKFHTAVAADELPDYGTLEGVYDVVGRKPDSQETYTGAVELRANATGLRVERRIGASTVVGTAQFEFKTPDKIQVLQIKFKDGEKSYESICRIGWDLDNYARITCLYGVMGKTESPGMEAFFIQQQPSQ